MSELSNELREMALIVGRMMAPSEVSDVRRSLRLAAETLDLVDQMMAAKDKRQAFLEEESKALNATVQNMMWDRTEAIRAGAASRIALLRLLSALDASVTDPTRDGGEKFDAAYEEARKICPVLQAVRT